MYAQVDKPKENKSRAVANSVAQKKSNGKQGFGFFDNRPEAVAQRKQLVIQMRLEAIIQLFNEMKILTVGSERFDIEMAGECHTRSQLIFDNVDSDRFEKKQVKLEYPDDSSWDYHIATAVKQKDVQGGEWWVLDTSFTSQPLVVSDWATYMYKKKSDEVKATQNDHSSGRGVQYHVDLAQAYIDNLNEEEISSEDKVALKRMKMPLYEDLFESLGKDSRTLMNEIGRRIIFFRKLIIDLKSDSKNLNDASGKYHDDEGIGVVGEADMINLLAQIRSVKL